MPEIPTLITTAELIEGIKKWKERTSTSPSGRHLGHLKAMLANQKMKMSLSKVRNFMQSWQTCSTPVSALATFSTSALVSIVV
jgi:hypothetical protein